MQAPQVRNVLRVHKDELRWLEAFLHTNLITWYEEPSEIPSFHWLNFYASERLGRILAKMSKTNTYFMEVD